MILGQPPACDGDNPIDCVAVNLSDNVVTGTLTEVPGCTVKTPAAGVCEATAVLASPILGIYWEPDNLRGRALASFDAQVSPYGTPAAGVITPVDYLVGRWTTVTGDLAPGSVADITIWAQPIAFSCPAGVLLNDPVKFCGMPSGSVVADQSFLGPLLANTSSIAVAWNPQTVGQGFSAAAMTSNPLVVPVSPEATNRLYVGDARPIQVMFREGLLYEARNVRLFDSSNNALGTSTVLYDIIRTCATGAPNPTCSYSANGSALALTPPFLNMEVEWTNGQNVSDPANDVPGFGFYAPMFDSPANVVNSGPTSPIAVESWLEKLFVGMTTGGTSNLSATFNVDFPSLWDFRPGDDAYDTTEPYIDPYTGTVQTAVDCPNLILVTGQVTKGSATVTVSSTAGLFVGMFVSGTPNGSGNIPLTLTPASQGGGTVTANPTVPNGTTIQSIGSGTITLSSSVTFPAADTGTSAVVNISFAKTGNTVNVTVASTATNTTPAVSATVAGGGLINGLNEAVITAGVPPQVQIGSSVAGRIIADNTAPSTGVVACAVAPADQCAGGIGGALLVVGSLTNVGPGMTVGTSATLTVSASIITGSTTIAVPAATSTGGGIIAGDAVYCATAGCGIPAGTTVATGNGDAGGTSVVLSAAPTKTAGAVTLIFSSALPTSIVDITATIGSVNVVGLSVALANDVPVGRTIWFSSGDLICAGTPGTGGCPTTGDPTFSLAAAGLGFSGNSVTNIGSNGVVFLTNDITLPAGITSTCPTIAPPLAAAGTLCTNNIPVTFGPPSVSCPLIQWSPRGGASTDPNDGSLWLFGEFAKYRLASVPGPGQWGTSIANYALDFPASDPYNNDNTYFTDVPSTNGFFTWIQIAKNLGLAQPSGAISASSSGITNPPGSTNAACSTNGHPPVLQPPGPGQPPTTTTPSTLVCAQFGPTNT